MIQMIQMIQIPSHVVICLFIWVKFQSSPHRQARRVNEYESLACHLGQYEARQQLAWGSDMAVCIGSL